MLKKSLPSQNGSTLIEGLVAILIFSFALLGVIGLQATTMKYNLNAQLRAQASFYAEQLIGMAAADPENVNCYLVSNSLQGSCTSSVALALADEWLDDILLQLPGASDLVPETTFDDSTRRFQLIIQWKGEQEETINNLTIETVINDVEEVLPVE